MTLSPSSPVMLSLKAVPLTFSMLIRVSRPKPPPPTLGPVRCRSMTTPPVAAGKRAKSGS